MNGEGPGALEARPNLPVSVLVQGGAEEEIHPEPEAEPRRTSASNIGAGCDVDVGPAAEAHESAAAEADPGEPGLLHVTTSESEYILDLRRRLVRRQPVSGVALRRDSRWIPVRHVLLLEVGRPMVLLLDVRGDGVVTVRQSTTVLRIVRT